MPDKKLLKNCKTHRNHSWHTDSHGVYFLLYIKNINLLRKKNSYSQHLKIVKLYTVIVQL